jgi:hypothetical protein
MTKSVMSAKTKVDKYYAAEVFSVSHAIVNAMLAEGMCG